MKIGSLVVALQDYAQIKDFAGVRIEGVTPSSDTICEVTAIYENEGEMIIKVAESTVYYYDYECGFLKKLWVELQEDISVESLLEEIEEHLCVPLY